jgi:hypothetical protein
MIPLAFYLIHKEESPPDAVFHWFSQRLWPRRRCVIKTIVAAKREERRGSVQAEQPTGIEKEVPRG